MIMIITANLVVLYKDRKPYPTNPTKKYSCNVQVKSQYATFILSDELGDHELLSSRSHKAVKNIIKQDEVFYAPPVLPSMAELVD